ncbi:unnamed protein product, partial [Staurois parvus]
MVRDYGHSYIVWLKKDKSPSSSTIKKVIILYPQLIQTKAKNPAKPDPICSCRGQN